MHGKICISHPPQGGGVGRHVGLDCAIWWCSWSVVDSLVAGGSSCIEDFHRNGMDDDAK